MATRNSASVVMPSTSARIRNSFSMHAPAGIGLPSYADRRGLPRSGDLRADALRINVRRLEYRAREHGHCVFRLHRAPEQIALDDVAAKIRQQLELRGCLDA